MKIPTEVELEAMTLEEVEEVMADLDLVLERVAFYWNEKKPKINYTEDNGEL